MRGARSPPKGRMSRRLRESSLAPVAMNRYAPSAHCNPSLAEATPVVTKTYQNLIGGEWTPAGSGATFTSVSPANRDDVVGEFAASGPADVDAAVGGGDARVSGVERHAGAEARRDPVPHRAAPC